MKNNCSNCKYWDSENRFNNGEDGYCDHKSFLESVYTTNKDEPGIIVVKPDFCCKFYKPKTNLQYQIEKQNKINELFENGKDIDPELTKNFITFPIK